MRDVDKELQFGFIDLFGMDMLQHFLMHSVPMSDLKNNDKYNGQ